ncbi:uncharacterized protein A4U43_C07F21820 [Asparagus officinalis]|uniref:Leucine-rich repeat-containing N-terminal plant-type domain-containing protein n=1 Tax=Asparagus officinalis TaxID=4686 RepID=A0A5P1EE14_ASPOF|nr:uncharacterized protein A4U43_C07F21820 [Asparagus officinalis]
MLRLRSNVLEGSIPEQLSLLENLQVLDLADNNLSGTIPQWLGNLTAMSSSEQTIIKLFKSYKATTFLDHEEVCELIWESITWKDSTEDRLSSSARVS